MKIFISAAQSRQFFVNTIENLLDTEYVGKHEYAYLPWQPGSPRDASLLERIRDNIIESELVLMDVTPEKCVCNGNEVWRTNQGVLIEYGIVVAEVTMLRRLSLFCEDTVDRDRIHPAFHKVIEQYSVTNAGQLEDLVKKIIDNMEKYIMSKDREQERRMKALEYIIRSSG